MTKKTFGPHNKPQGKRGPKDSLTDKERKLAQGLVGGLTMKAALQKAGYASSVLSSADSVLNRPRFVRYIDGLRTRQVERLDYSIDNLCARLERVYFEAMEKSQYGPAVQAVMGVAKLMGHLTDKTEIELHILSKPSRDPTDVVTLSVEEWQRQFAPKRVGYGAAEDKSPNGSSPGRNPKNH
jgi:hypothetical protein